MASADDLIRQQIMNAIAAHKAPVSAPAPAPAAAAPVETIPSRPADLNKKEESEWTTYVVPQKTASSVPPPLPSPEESPEETSLFPSFPPASTLSTSINSITSGPNSGSEMSESEPETKHASPLGRDKTNKKSSRSHSKSKPLKEKKAQHLISRYIKDTLQTILNSSSQHLDKAERSKLVKRATKRVYNEWYQRRRSAKMTEFLTTTRQVKINKLLTRYLEDVQ